MTLEQRAQQFWSVLVFAAKEQELVSYSLLSQITGFYDPPSTVLYYIFCYCKHHGLPPLNAIVIDPTTGRPGEDCPREVRDWSTQQSRVFLFNWLDHPAPPDGMFKEALAKQEEMEMANAGYIALSC